jgi:hypothetical protein
MSKRLGRTPLDIPESLIRYAMENTNSNKEAAQFLHLSLDTYKKYAKLYIDSATGLSLYQLHIPKDLKGIPKRKWAVRNKNAVRYLPDDILLGKYPHLDPFYVLDRLLNCGAYPAICSHCGYSERRIDGKVPLRLDHLDGDRTNHRADNIRILCYNCSFLLVGEWRSFKVRTSWYKKNMVTPADPEWNEVKIPKPQDSGELSQE